MAKHKKQQAAIAISMKKKGKKPKGAKPMAKSVVKKRVVQFLLKVLKLQQVFTG